MKHEQMRGIEYESEFLRDKPKPNEYIAIGFESRILGLGMRRTSHLLNNTSFLQLRACSAVQCLVF